MAPTLLPPDPAEEQQPDRDHRTIQLLLAGDADGLRHLLLDHAGALMSLLRREFQRAADDSEIQDAIGQATECAWRFIARFDPAVGGLRAWLYVIARNRLRRTIATRDRHPTIQLVKQASPILEGTDPSPRQVILAADVRRCIEALPPLQRAVIDADLLAGGARSAAELARELDSTMSSIYAARSLGRKALRASLAALGHGFADSIEPTDGDA